MLQSALQLHRHVLSSLAHDGIVKCLELTFMCLLLSVEMAVCHVICRMLWEFLRLHAKHEPFAGK